jgi:hypothetical protein
MRPEIQKLLSEIKACYAGWQGVPESGRRFRELVATDDRGCDHQR